MAEREAMAIATIDCGTTNSRIYIVDESAKILGKATKKVGVRDTAISGSTRALKEGLRETFDKALADADLRERDIRCVLSSGMITSEIGLIELPHLWAPCDIDRLAANMERVEDPEVFPSSVPTYFVRGIKNRYDPGHAAMNDVGNLDFMRGEEAQIAGLLSDGTVLPPVVVTILSSHTKFVPVDERGTILGSITTLSGQLYEALLKETFVGKSVRSEDDFDDHDYFDPKVADIAYDWIRKSGLLRGLMFPRFLDTLLHEKWYDRRLFTECLLAAEDMRALEPVRKMIGTERLAFVLIGQKRRTRIYEYFLKTQTDMAMAVSALSDEDHIDRLSIRGVLHLAKRAGIL